MTETTHQYSEADQARINQAVQSAESQTSAEIVPVIAHSSGRYDRPEDIVGLWIGALAMIAAWAVYPLPRTETGHWGGTAAYWQLVVLLVALVAGFVLGAFVATRVMWLRRLFAPQSQMEDEVRSRAHAAFFDQRVHHTAGASGVLLYVSLFERMAVVLTDQSVLEQLGQETIDALCNSFTQRLRASGPIEALCQTAQEAGEKLAQVLPRAAGDVNELPDALVVLG